MGQAPVTGPQVFWISADVRADMSAPVAGKFQDHYSVLGVDPSCDADAIQKAYAQLAEKFQPNNKETGNKESFDAVNLAYEILSDPTSRRDFDVLKGIGPREGVPKFSGAEFFDAFGRDAGLRTAVLCLLYDRRRTRPYTPTLSLRHLENLLDSTTEELNFALWYLKQRTLVAADDKSSLQITVDGMDYLANSSPSQDVVMPFIKAPAAEAAHPKLPEAPPPAAQVTAPTPGPPPQRESARSVLDRVLARR
jgi:curved DNA-binding protein